MDFVITAAALSNKIYDPLAKFSISIKDFGQDLQD